MTHESLFSALLAPFPPPPPHRYSDIPTVLHLSTTKLEGCKFQSIDPRSSACRVVEYHCNFKVTITLQTVCLMALLLLLLAYVVYYGGPPLTWNLLTRSRLTRFLAMWMIFALVDSLYRTVPLTQISCKESFFKYQNPCNTGNPQAYLCSVCNVRNISVVEFSKLESTKI